MATASQHRLLANPAYITRLADALRLVNTATTTSDTKGKNAILLLYAAVYATINRRTRVDCRWVGLGGTERGHVCG